MNLIAFKIIAGAILIGLCIFMWWSWSIAFPQLQLRTITFWVNIIITFIAIFTFNNIMNLKETQ